jgi:hypothetical protein
VTRAYIRVDPGLYERKVIEQKYPLGAFAALEGCFCYGETQPVRGTFRDAALLRAHLGPGGRWVPFLIEQGDLILMPGGQLYIDGWKEWQEGDVTVKERMERIRNRKHDRNVSRNVDRIPPVRAESGAGQSGKPRTARRNDGEPIALHELLDV